MMCIYKFEQKCILLLDINKKKINFLSFSGIVYSIKTIFYLYMSIFISFALRVIANNFK